MADFHSTEQIIGTVRMLWFADRAEIFTQKAHKGC